MNAADFDILRARCHALVDSAIDNLIDDALAGGITSEEAIGAVGIFEQAIEAAENTVRRCDRCGLQAGDDEAVCPKCGGRLVAT